MTDDDTDATRRFVRDLFRLDEEDEPGAPATSGHGNVVPKEGSNPPPPKADEMRDFVSRLFHNINPGDHARN